MTWTAEELATIAAAGEIDLVPRRPDDRLGPATTIWIVRVGDDLYVRSYRGPGAGGTATLSAPTKDASTPGTSSAT